MKRRVFTARAILALASCSILFGILWLGVALGCDDVRGCDRPHVEQHYEKWVTR